MTDWPLAEIRVPRRFELGLFPPLVGNLLSLDGYVGGDGFMIGDRVIVRRALGRSGEGTVMGFKKSDRPLRKARDRFAIHGVLVGLDGRGLYCRPSSLHLASRPAEYRDYWAALYGMNVKYWREAAGSDPLNPWAKSDPSPTAGLGGFEPAWSLRDGLQIAYSGKDPDLAHMFYRRAIAQADRLLGRIGIEADDGDRSAPLIISVDRELEVTRARAFAAALLGQSFDTGSLTRSARHWADECAGISAADWSELDKLKLLRAAAWAMIAGDLDHAREILASKRSFSNHEDHRDLLRNMARNSAPQTDRPLVDGCRAFFDLIRHPRGSENRETYGRQETAFEWALLMAKCIDRPDDEIDWRTVVEAVSR